MFVSTVGDVATDFKLGPALLLTEEDLRCQIYSRLRERFDLTRLVPTADRDVQGAALHCDISWFDPDGYLYHRPDITILEPENLSIRRPLDTNLVTLPSKGANFVGRALIAEIKFHRHLAAPTEKWLGEVADDLRKVIGLMGRHGETLVAVMVVFSRYRRHIATIEGLLQLRSEGIPYLTHWAIDE